MYPPVNTFDIQKKCPELPHYSPDAQPPGQFYGHTNYSMQQRSPPIQPPVEQFSAMNINQFPQNANGQMVNQDGTQDHGYWQHSASQHYANQFTQHYPPSNQVPDSKSNQSMFPPIPPFPQPVEMGREASNVVAPPYPGPQLHSPVRQNYPNSPPMGPPQPKKISAESFPSAVQVIESNRAQYDSFITTERSVVPPLASTNFTCRDGGNCNPRFVRSSMYAVPVSSDMIKTIGLPFTITISPFANQHPEDQPIPLGEMGTEGPVRCNRCRAYINPFAGFIDGGRRFQCQLCSGLTNVRDSYFAHLDHTGRRTDVYHRPELCLGSYELTTTVEYCKNNEPPNPPAFIFIVDVSQTSLRSGLVHLFCSQFVDRVLPHVARDPTEVPNGDSLIRVGFITYDHQLHFYSLATDKSSSSHAVQNGVEALGRPQMHIVADVSDVFVPAVEGFLIPPNPQQIASLLHLVPTQLSADPSHATPDAMLGPAIQAGLEALKAANRPGKLFVFHSNLPTADGPGKLKNREDSRLIGTDKEKTLLAPCTDYYTNLGQSCVDAGCSVDLFLFPNAFTDVATLAEVPRLSAGHLYKYNCFQADLQGLQFLSDLELAVARPKAFNAVLRVRTSAGIRPVEFFGNFHVPNTTDVELACVDPETTLTVEIRHDDKLQDKDVAFIQVACLYTSLSGQRRLRIHNLSLSTTSSIPEVFRLAELDTHMNWMFKFALQSVRNRAYPQVVDDLTARIAHTLAAYRRHSSGGPNDLGSDSAQLILPHDMKLYPLYVQCLMKSEAFAPANSIPIDERARLIFLVNGMDVKRTSLYLYPRLYPVHQLSPDVAYPPPAVRCSIDYLQPMGAYLLDNGVNLFLWLGPNLPEDWIQSVFMGSSVGPFEPEKFYDLPQMDSEASRNLRCIIGKLNEEHSRHPRLLVVRSGDKLEAYFRRFLVEDSFGSNTVSYAQYLCHVHKEVCSLLR